MKNITLIGAFLLALSSSASVFAIDGITFNISGGYTLPSGIPTKSQQAGATERSVKTPRTVQALIGYHHEINPYIDVGFLAGYALYGEVNYTIGGQNYKATDNNLLFLGSLLLHVPSWNISTQLLGGLARNGFVVKSNGQTQSSRVTQAYAGINLLYDFNKHFSAGVGYNHIFGSKIDDITNINGKAPTLDNFLVTLQYIF